MSPSTCDLQLVMSLELIRRSSWAQQIDFPTIDPGIFFQRMLQKWHSTWAAQGARPEHAAALEDSFGKSSSKDRWENTAGTRHIRAIALAESFKHHSLFSGNAAKKQSPKPEQACESGKPIRQQ